MNSDKDIRGEVDLESLRALCEAATPGPWRAAHESLDRPGFTNIDGDHWFALAEVVTTFNGYGSPQDEKLSIEGKANAAFIAASRQAVPAMIEEIVSLRRTSTSAPSRQPPPVRSPTRAWARSSWT